MILITGGAGYIGSHAVIEFCKDNDVVIFDNLSTGHIETVKTLEKITNKVHFEKGDLNNIEDIERVFNKYDIEGVIHFAAFSIVSESIKNPVKYYKNNIRGSYNLLKTMVKHNVLKIVFSSTAAVYGNTKCSFIDENHALNPINPYGLSKLTIERILDNFDKKYNLKSIKLRYFNVIGADCQTRVGEWHNVETHIIPNLLKTILNKNETFKIFGDNYKTKDGTCIRDYINVEDLIKAHRLAFEYLKKENTTNVFNLGAGNNTSVKDIIETTKKVTETDIKVEIAPRRFGDPDVLCAVFSKANKILKWQPQKSLEESILSAYKWEKARSLKS